MSLTRSLDAYVRTDVVCAGNTALGHALTLMSQIKVH